MNNRLYIRKHTKLQSLCNWRSHHFFLPCLHSRSVNWKLGECGGQNWIAPYSWCYCISGGWLWLSKSSTRMQPASASSFMHGQSCCTILLPCMGGFLFESRINLVVKNLLLHKKQPSQSSWTFWRFVIWSPSTSSSQWQRSITTSFACLASFLVTNY